MQRLWTNYPQWGSFILTCLFFIYHPALNGYDEVVAPLLFYFIYSEMSYGHGAQTFKY